MSVEIILQENYEIFIVASADDITTARPIDQLTKSWNALLSRRKQTWYSYPEGSKHGM